MSEPAVRLMLNGAQVVVADVPPTLTLLEWLRGRGLTGTKEGCAEGDCGACTVAVSRPESAGEGLETRALNACIMPLAMAHGASVTTVEGIANASPSGRHPIQTAMAEQHASQCGFCTPGFVMSLFARPKNAPTHRQALEDRLAGNLCRCTGYGPILSAGAASAPQADLLHDEAQDRETANALRGIGPLDCVSGEHRTIAPVDEDTFAHAVADNPGARIIAGATDVGLWITKSLYDPGVAILINRVAALSGVRTEGDQLVVGAATTHDEFHRVVAAYSAQLAELLRRFAGLQVRQAGTVGGNIANGSPIGDLPPALIAAGATLTLRHRDDVRCLPLEDFFIGYGKQDRRPGEYVRSVAIPLAGLSSLSCHKVSKRFDSDITAVLGAFSLDLKDGIVRSAGIAFGGMAATPKRARHAEAALIGEEYTPHAVKAASAALEQDFQPISDLRASAAYRMTVAKNLLVRDHAERTSRSAQTRLTGPALEKAA
ncbi:MAG: xanthine dehydrogenase small subunit [Pseudomonadota bacterium]